MGRRFVDEDTGEVVSIERTEVIIERETVLWTVILTDPECWHQNHPDHKEDALLSDYSIIFNTLQKDTANSEKEAVEYIYRQLRNAEPPDEETARGIIDNCFFSDKRYDLGDVGQIQDQQETEPEHPYRDKSSYKRRYYLYH